jgi:hypothetical protein
MLLVASVRSLPKQREQPPSYDANITITHVIQFTHDHTRQTGWVNTRLVAWLGGDRAITLARNTAALVALGQQPYNLRPQGRPADCPLAEMTA